MRTAGINLLKAVMVIKQNGSYQDFVNDVNGKKEKI